MLVGLVVGVLAGMAPQAFARAQTTAAGAPDIGPARVPIVFDHVTVIDVENGRRLGDRRVVVRGTRIETVGPIRSVPVPAGARVVNAAGKYLIPGLWDMHLHPMCHVHPYYPLLIANGITGIRDAGTTAPIDTVRQWQRDVASGRRIGPRHVIAGPYLDAGVATDPTCGDEPHSLAIGGPDEARRAVDSLRRAGADYIKFHEFSTEHDSRRIFFAVAAEARRVGIPFSGHRPPDVTAIELSDSGAVILDHGDFFIPECFGDSASVAACTSIAGRLRRNGTWVLVTVGGAASRFDRYWPDSLLNQMGVRLGDTTAWTSKLPMIPEPSAEPGSALRVARRAGLPMVVGTDGAPTRLMIVPGIASQAVVANLVRDGGLTPADALRAATVNAAKALRATDSLGTVAAGKVADLVLLDADPLADITNVRKVHAVIANGRYFDRATLDSLVDDVVRRARP